MNTLALALSVAFLVGVSAFPRHLGERPISAVYLIPQDQVIPLLQLNSLPMAMHARGLVQKMASDEEEVEHPTFTAQENQNAYGAEEEAAPSSTIGRSRRSTQPGAPSTQQQSGGGDRGGVDVSVSRGEGGGRRVEATGEGNVWQSRDGRGRVDVHGHYSRDYGGRYGTGRPQYGGGVRYSHRF